MYIVYPFRDRKSNKYLITTTCHCYVKYQEDLISIEHEYRVYQKKWYIQKINY